MVMEQGEGAMLHQHHQQHRRTFSNARDSIYEMSRDIDRAMNGVEGMEGVLTR